MSQPKPAVMQAEALGVKIQIPSHDKFGTAPYLAAPDLEKLGRALIKKHPDRLQSAAKFEITYLWKASGGTRFGAPLYGDCQRAGGLTEYAFGTEFVIWFAGDHLFEVGFMAAQLEALMFRQLCHIGVNNNTGSARYVGPEFVGFRDEIVLYGWWDEPLRQLGAAIKQPGLFDRLPDPEPPATPTPVETDPDKIAENSVNNRRRNGRASMVLVPPRDMPDEGMPENDPAGIDPANTDDDPFSLVVGADGIGADPEPVEP